MLKKYKPFLRAGAMDTMTYRFNILIWAVITVCQVACLVFLWLAVYRSSAGGIDAEIHGFTFREMISYVVLTTIFGFVTFNNDTLWYINTDIKKGTVGNYLIKPISYRGKFAATSLGNLLTMTLMFGVPLYTAALVTLGALGFLPRVTFPAFFAHLGLFLLAELCASLLNDTIAYIFGILCFYTSSGWGLNSLKTTLISFHFEGMELVASVAKLVFFLILWIIVGIFLIPLLLRWAKKLMNDETLLVVALGLCFGMVVIAAKTGFSAAFGAFIMGSILAETIEAEHIEHLVKPVKDLFGAIFFVSVGMMVDPAMIAQYWLPIVVITLTVIIGQLLFATTGVLLSGQNLKTAMQCGFSLTQIGEFAFIIATLGVSLGVTGSFLYPIVVAVSVITIFLTPYMIRLAEPAYGVVYKHLPGRVRTFLDNYAASSASPTTSKQSEWKKYLGSIIRVIVIYGILCIAVCGLSFGLLVPFVAKWLPAPWANIFSAVVTLVVLSPFLRSLVIKHSHSEDFKLLWAESRANRAPLVATVVLRYILALGFIFYVLARLFHISVVLIFLIALVAVFAIVSSRFIKRNAQRLERNFMDNFRSRELRAEYMGQKKPEYASRLLSKDLHLADFDVPAEIDWGGKTLAQLNFGQRFGIQVVSILRGGLRINIPKATDRVFPQDRIQVIGADAELESFGEHLKASAIDLEDDRYHSGEMVLKCVPVTGTSPFLGQTIRDAAIRNRYHCLVAGVEKSDGELHAPIPTMPFEEGDILWLVGEKEDVERAL